MRKRARPPAAPWRRLAAGAVAAGALAHPGCRTPEPPDDPVERGRRIFFEETFAGNGRTCGTCHPAENNFTLDPAFIAGLPPDDPLFVAERVPELGENFENPRLLRELALILENQDGFDDLENRFVLRGIPHTLGLRTSVASPGGPKTGWSGDGAPGDRSLRSFATGAVIQHFTKTLARVPGVDFRLPTEEELDALEAFQLSLGRQAELELPLPLRGAQARRGQEIFLDDSLGKCNICHRNAGANAFLNGADLGNANFSTGVEALPDRPAHLTGERVPPDDGQGFPGDGTFNTPPLVEAADTPPFFHDDSAATLEGAVAFYSGDAFAASPSGRFLASLDPRGIGIRLDATQTQAVAAFLRVLNALENVRQSRAALEQSLELGLLDRARARRLLESAVEETGDAIRVLAEAGLHPAAVRELEEARRREERAGRSLLRRRALARQAIGALERARAELVLDRSFGSVTLTPDFELDGAGTNVDSLAFFEAPDPEQTLLFVTAKDNQLVEVWRFPFAGNEQAPLTHASFGSGTQVNGIAVDQAHGRLYVATSRPASTVAAFALPGLAFQGETLGGAVDLGSEPNLALLPRPDGSRWLYASADAVVHVRDAGSGAEIGRFQPSVGLETMVGDPRDQVVYVPDENGGTGVMAYDPLGTPHLRAGTNRFGTGVFDEDAEGILLYRCSEDPASDDGSGFLVVSDQRGDHTEFEFFDRRTWQHLGALVLDGVANTDGIASTQRPLPGWPRGLFAAIDDDSTTAVIGWDRILAATGLCPSAAPAPPVTASSGRAVGGHP